MAENNNYVVDEGQNLIKALNKNETESAISEAIESAVSEINAKFADYYNKTEIDGTFENYYLKTEIDAFNLEIVNEIYAFEGVWLTQTLTAGATTVVFSDSSITTDSLVRVFSSVYGVNPINISVVNGSVTMTFLPQSTDVSIILNVFLRR